MNLCNSTLVCSKFVWLANLNILQCLLMWRSITMQLLNLFVILVSIEVMHDLLADAYVSKETYCLKIPIFGSRTCWRRIIKITCVTAVVIAITCIVLIVRYRRKSIWVLTIWHMWWGSILIVVIDHHKFKLHISLRILIKLLQLNMMIFAEFLEHFGMLLLRMHCVVEDLPFRQLSLY